MEASITLNPAICQLAVECVASLRAHAASELAGLFAAATGSPAEEAASLQEGFRQVDERETRPGEQQALRALAAAIDRRREPRARTVDYAAEIVAAHVMRAWPRAVRPADTLARAVELMDQATSASCPSWTRGALRHRVTQRSTGPCRAPGVDGCRGRDDAPPGLVTPEQSVGAVSQVLMRGRFNAVPVVGDDAILIGMISRSDMLRAVADHANGDDR